MLSPRKINSENEYKQFAEEYYYLADEELKKYETMMQKGEHSDIAYALPKLISLVNIAGYLRGQDNMFVDFRPTHLSIQSELYQCENEFEERLYKLIDYVKTSPSAEKYRSRLDQYYIQARGFPKINS